MIGEHGTDERWMEMDRRCNFLVSFSSLHNYLPIIPAYPQASDCIQVCMYKYQIICLVGW